MWYQQPTGGTAFNLADAAELSVQSVGSGWAIFASSGSFGGTSVQIGAYYVVEADAEAVLSKIIAALGVVVA